MGVGVSFSDSAASGIPREEFVRGGSKTRTKPQSSFEGWPALAVAKMLRTGDGGSDPQKMSAGQWEQHLVSFVGARKREQLLDAFVPRDCGLRRRDLYPEKKEARSFFRRTGP
jgi:hypothetical protein